MKIVQKNIQFYALIGLYSLCYASDPNGPHNMINGIIVTSETVLDIVPSLDNTEPVFRNSVRKFVAAHAAKLVELSQLPEGTGVTSRSINEKHEKNLAFARGLFRREAVLRQFEKSQNYFLPIYSTDDVKAPESDEPIALIKVAHIGSRMRTFFSTQVGDPYHPNIRAEFATLNFLKYTTEQERPPLFPDISGAVNCARLRDVQKGRREGTIQKKRSFLVLIPGRPAKVCDGNYVFVQPYCKKTAESICLADKPEIMQSWSPERINDMRYIVKQAALWACRGNFRYHEKDDAVLYPDDEQADNTVGGEGFGYQEYNANYFPGHKSTYLFGRGKWNHDGQTGLDELDGMIKESGWVDPNKLAEQVDKLQLS